MRNKKGFTLLEAVDTIAVLGISLGLATLVMSSLVRVQDASVNENLINDDLNSLDKVVSSYVSMVSQKTDGIQFQYKAKDSKYLTFTAFSCDFTLSYEANTISYSSNYGTAVDQDIDYLKQRENVLLSYISDVSFDYNVSLKLLVVRAETKGYVNRFTYVLRAE